MHIHHIGIEVHDLFAMERFYRLALGFRLDYRYESRNTPGLRTVFLGRQDVRLELLARGDSAAPSSTTGNAAKEWGHFALACPDVDHEWQDLCQRAQTAGYECRDWNPPRDTGDGYREARVIDPEGNLIELCQNLRPKTRPAIRGVIFDFDGTLVDSEPNYYQAIRQIMAEYGVDYSEADNQRYVGLGNSATLSDLISRYGLPVDLDSLSGRKEERYLDLASRNTPVFPAMTRFLDLVQAAGLPVAVASGSSQRILERLLETTGMRDRFALVLSSEKMARGKPAPDVFLAAAEGLGLPAETCLVVEDSAPGTEAAARAGMPCIAIPSLVDCPLHPTFGLAEYLVEKGMSAFDPDHAFRWLRHFPDL